MCPPQPWLSIFCYFVPPAQGPANIEAIALLVELGADVEATLAQRSLETPLHIAARSGRSDVVDRLLKCQQVWRRAGRESGARGAGQGAQHCHAAAASLLRSVAAPGQGGAAGGAPGPQLAPTPRPPRGIALQISVTCRTKDGSTALHYAAAFGQTHVLAPLVAAGCPVDSRDNALNTPMHLAAGTCRAVVVGKRNLCGAAHHACFHTICGRLQEGQRCSTCLSICPPPCTGSSSVVGPVASTLLTVTFRTPPPRPLPAGCGFLDTVAALSELGADVNARDITDCTSLQNAAHGTYSALASVPAVGSSAASPVTPPPATGYARLNPPHQPQLTPAQQAAQAAISASGTSTVKRDGLVPVRTGLAWAPIGGAAAGPIDPLLSSASSLWGGSGFSATLDFGALGGGAAGAAGVGPLAPAGGAAGAASAAGAAGGQDLWSTWRSLGLTKLLKKAYNQQQRRQAGGAGAGGPAAAQAQLQQTQQTVQAALAQMQAALARSQEVLQQQLLLQMQVPPPADGGAAPAGDPLLLEAGPSSDPHAWTGLSAASVAPLGTALMTAGGAGGGAASSQLLGGADSSGLALAAAAAAITKPSVDSSNMDCLARRTDQLSFAAGEQDRCRLIQVGAGCWVLGAGCWVLGAGWWVLVAGAAASWLEGASRACLAARKAGSRRAGGRRLRVSSARLF